jgi:hypothetical protein
MKFTNEVAKTLQYLTLFCLVIIFSSCGDDPIAPTTQSSEGPTPTEVGTPNGSPVTASIGPSGGSITSSDSTMKLVIPPGALSGSTDITIQPITNFCFNGQGNAFKLTPENIQFTQPVKIEIHYADSTLAGTLGMLMGIAHQDASGYWHYFNDITNDTVNRVISVELTQFSSANRNSGQRSPAGGNSVSLFDIAHIYPMNASLPVNGHLTFRVSYINTVEDGDDILPYLPYPIGNWFVSQGGGTITSTGNQSALFTAPGQVPQQNPVTVGANVNTRLNYRGQVISQTALTTTVKIVSGDHKFDLVINVTGDMGWLANYQCTYTDGVNMVVTITNGSPSTVSVSNVTNRFPNVTPPGGTFPNGQGSITYIPENIGLTDVLTVSGNVYGPNQDHFDLALNHTPNLRMPKWHAIPPPGHGDPHDVGGGPGFPIPTAITFLNADTTQTRVIDNGIVKAHITLTPRH